MSNELEILRKLSGTEQDFVQALVQLGWFDYPPTLTNYEFRGKARFVINPQLKAAGEVGTTDAWVYRLVISSNKWQDAVAVMESQLKKEPQFAITFCPLPSSLLVLIPENPEKAFRKAKSGLTIDRIYLDTRQPSNYEIEKINKLKEALNEQFRRRLQELPNTEKVTKKFYERFKNELQDFQRLIAGVSLLEDQVWYSSVMLNRLMFIYFLQQKGFLDGDRDYLANRLRMVREQRGENQFQSFYRSFLLRLFHEGLGSKRREDDFEAIMGKVPYLNGGLFEVHEIESRYLDDLGNNLIDIPDEAFDKVFKFFGDFDWCLDTRPSRTEREINPDVLGYIFEKYINQKQMGAYYTKEDITDYIAKNTIIPDLFDKVQQKCKESFTGDGSIWGLLQANTDRYIYEAVKKGTELELPPEIAAGWDDTSKRDNWNTPAPEEYALPTEIWREVVARRKRYLDVREKLVRGEVKAIDDLITLNLDIRRFAQDVIEQTDNPELIRNFWDSMAGYIQQVGSNKKEIPPLTILDPTCGSGAFLFAALNILGPLYESCLERMEQFTAQADSAGEPRKYPDFRHVLERVNDREKHPNRDYFILKSIILNNLYGVDIMPEAVEICKLRLFLKMAAVVEPDESKPNYDLEPLPDIDFNIRAGNTLVGFVSEDDIRGVTMDSKPKQISMFVDSEPGEQMALIANTEESNTFKNILDKLELADKAHEQYRRQQVEYGGEVTAEDKINLRKQLSVLENELNRYLAKQYKIDADRQKEKYEKWLKSHQPFHWCVEFYGIMKRGGFDVIIGNPPYVEYSKIRDEYKLLGTLESYSTNLYSACCYRAIQLKNVYGYNSFIVPVSLPSTDRMQVLRDALLKNHNIHFVGFSTRPSKLFEGAEQRLVIYIQSPSLDPNLYSGGYLKWYSEERQQLFEKINYVFSKVLFDRNNIWLKTKGKIEQSIFEKMFSHKSLKHLEMLGLGASLYYKNTGIRYFNTVTLKPPKCWINGIQQSSSRETILSVQTKYLNLIHIYLLSSTFFLHYQATSNCRDLNPSDIHFAPFPNTKFDLQKLNELSLKIDKDYTSKAKRLTMNNKLTGTVELESLTPARSKIIIDEIDRELAKYFGLTDEELDYIINYDIKYRMGINGMEDGE